MPEITLQGITLCACVVQCRIRKREAILIPVRSQIIRALEERKRASKKDCKHGPVNYWADHFPFQTPVSLSKESPYDGDTVMLLSADLEASSPENVFEIQVKVVSNSHLINSVATYRATFFSHNAINTCIFDFGEFF